MLAERLPAEWSIECWMGGRAARASELEKLTEQFPKRVELKRLQDPFGFRRLGVFLDLLRVLPAHATVAHGTSNVLPLFGARLRILTVHDLLQAYPVVEQSSLYIRLRSAWYRFAYSRVLKRIAFVVTDHPSTVAAIKERFGEKLAARVVFPPLADEYLAHAVSVEREHFALAFASQDRRKNIEAVLEEFASLSADQCSRLVIVCSSTAVADRVREQAQRAGVADRVGTQVALSCTDLAELYSKARVLWYPSLAEGFGYPIYEALSQGTPVLCHHGVIPNRLWEGVSPLVQVGDLSDRAVLRKLMLASLKLEPSLIVAQAAANFVREELAPARAAEQLWSIYQEVLPTSMKEERTDGNKYL